MMAKKTDNSNLGAKLDLRRYFLKKYHTSEPIKVLDCCQGEGVIWSRLRSEFPIASYWGTDMKPKAGRLKIQSERILEQSGWGQNVIDIDTYGNPWNHWIELLRNISQPLTVFLTIGSGKGKMMAAGANISKESRKALGLGDLDVPKSMSAKLNRFSISYILSRCYDFDIKAIEAIEAIEAIANARYIGVRLEKTNGPASDSRQAVLDT